VVLIAAVTVTCFIGWLVIAGWMQCGWTQYGSTQSGSMQCGWVPALSLGFAAGAGILSLQMLFYGLLHLPWNPFLLLLPWAPLIYLRYRQSRLWPAFSIRHIARPNWLECVALIAMLAGPLAWLPYERVMPLNARNWDAWAIWLFKAKAFYTDGNLGSFLKRAGEFACQPSYPLLIPLYGTLIYRLAGAAVDDLAKAVTPCFFFALLGAFYYFARRFASRPVALVFTAMLANLHMVNIVAFELAGYADTALSVYLLAGAGFLYAWWKSGDSGDLILAALFSSLAAWTKNEGLFFLAGAVLVALPRLVRTHVPAKVWATAAIWPVIAVVPWLALRHAYGVPGTDVVGGTLALGNLWPGVEGILRQAVKPNVYNWTFWLLAASLFLFRRASLDSGWWLLPGAVFWQLLGLIGAYLSSRNEIEWWIGTSLDRILSQVAPLALLAPALVAGAWSSILQSRLPQAAAPAALDPSASQRKPSKAAGRRIRRG